MQSVSGEKFCVALMTIKLLKWLEDILIAKLASSALEYLF